MMTFLEFTLNGGKGVCVLFCLLVGTLFGHVLQIFYFSFKCFWFDKFAFLLFWNGNAFIGVNKQIMRLLHSVVCCQAKLKCICLLQGSIFWLYFCKLIEKPFHYSFLVNLCTNWCIFGVVLRPARSCIS